MKFAVTIFAIVSLVIMMIATVDFTPRKYVSVVGDDELKLYAGSEIITKKDLILEYEATSINLSKRTNFTVKSLRRDRLEFFASRGNWNISPDREIMTCTRAVCAITSSNIEVRYYTPGEIVELETSGETLVTFNGESHVLQSNDRMRIDELTGHTLIQSPNDGIDTSSTP